MDGNLKELVEPELLNVYDHNEDIDAPVPAIKHRFAGINRLLPGYPNWLPPTLRFGDPSFTPFADLGVSRGAFGQSVVDSTVDDRTSTEEDSGNGGSSSDVGTLQAKLQRLQDLSALVKAGDESAIYEIRRILISDEKLWQCLGNVEQTTEAMLIEYLSGTAATKEAVRIRVTELNRSLVSSNATPLEQLAVGRVVACWLFTQFIERWSGFAIKETGRTAGLAKLLESSEKRLQTALKSLKLAQWMRS